MDNKVILITGASSGIGLACADHLTARGWTVVGASRRAVAPGPWHPMTMDVDDDASVEAGVAQILETYGRLDAVVANAGWGLAGAVELTSTTEAKAQMETNFFGVVRVVRAALPHLRACGSGRVVIMSSIAGVVGVPFQAFYSASKFALEGYAEALAYEVHPFHVEVTLVQPGNFRTEFTENRRDVSVESGRLYDAAVAKALHRMEQDERDGADPLDAALAVEKVLAARRPPRRVSVGKPGERVGVIAKRVIPFRFFERAARSSLGV